MDNEKRYKIIQDALSNYFCQYAFDRDGNNSLLVDILSSGETIRDGKQEIVHLAGHILDSLLPSEKECERCKRLEKLLHKATAKLQGRLYVAELNAKLMKLLECGEGEEEEHQPVGTFTINLCAECKEAQEKGERRDCFNPRCGIFEVNNAD